MDDKEYLMQWQTVARPLFRAPAYQFEHSQFDKLASFLISHLDDLLSNKCDLEPFYGSTVALTCDYIIWSADKVSSVAVFEPVLSALLKYLLSTCSKQLDRGEAVCESLLSESQIVGILKSLCTGTRSTDSSDILSYVSTLRSYLSDVYLSEGLDTPDSVEESEGGGDFLSRLSSYSVQIEEFADVEDKESSSRLKLADVCCHLLLANGGCDILLKCMQEQPYLKKFREGLDRLIAGEDILSPTRTAEAVTFKNTLAPILNNMSVIQRIVTIPAMLYSKNETVLKELVYSALTALYTAAYAVQCSAIATSRTSEFDLAMVSLVKKASDILSGLSRNMKTSIRIALYIHTNLYALASWLIIRTIDAIHSQQQFPSNPWGMASHSLILEGLGCLLTLAKDSSSGHVPTSSGTQTKSTSSRLQEAQKFSISQFSLLKDYTYIELLKFLPSGSNLKLTCFLFTVTLSMCDKYKSLVEGSGGAAAVGKPSEPQPLSETDGTIGVAIPAAPTVMSRQQSSTTAANDDDSNDSFIMSDIKQLFLDEQAKDDRPASMDSTQSRSASPSSGNSTWIDTATSLVLFIDKYLVGSAVTKSYLTSELCQVRSQQCLSLLALLLKSTTNSQLQNDENYTKYSLAVKRMCKHMIQQQILNKNAQENLLLMIDLYPDNLAGWPVIAHRNSLYILMYILLDWQSKPSWSSDQNIIVEMWKHFLDAILSECLTANHDRKNTEDVNVEHCQAMLSLLYMLSEDNKKQVFVSLAKTVNTAMDTRSQQLVTMVPLPVTRLFLLLEYMLGHMTSAPEELLEQVKANILSDVVNRVDYTPEPGIDMTTASENDNTPVLYTLSQSEPIASKVDPLIISVLSTAEEYDLDLADFYSHCLTAMLVGSSLDKARKPENMTAMDGAIIHYHIQVVWRVLGLLPPPPAFLLQLTDVRTLGTQPAALQALRLAPKLRSTSYINWYKQCLTGAMLDTEIEALIESVVNRTKSPAYEVQIALHLIQAQMATLMFASENDYIRKDMMPGFHTIVILDAVIANTHALLDMFYQDLKINSGKTSATHEEARVLELKRVCEDYIPALLLLLGSFTQFVRSDLLNSLPPPENLSVSGAADEGESQITSCFKQLLMLSTSPDDTFTHYVAELEEITSLVKSWNGQTLSHYPSFHTWRKPVNKDSAAEEYMNSVIQGHCNSLSYRTDKSWSIREPLKHLHTTLVKLTCDINSWFPALCSSEDLYRTMLPLMFDVSCKSSATSEITSCLAIVLGQNKVNQWKYEYCMRRWHSLLLSLPDISKHISVVSSASLIQTVSFFMQACLEDEMTSGWLANFYTDKADLSAVLIVTGSPGCSDIVSINRILKVFTRIISKIESSSIESAAKPYAQLLKTLNKLSSIDNKVLCDWLQQVIMAAPSQSDTSNESESQIEKNASLLHTIASYMVKENSVIDKQVPQAILRSLITVATEVLHQTCNCQGFQELMLIMSTLAKEGDAVELVTAVISWLESCTSHIVDEKLESPKHTLYIELSLCLLSYINNIMSIINNGEESTVEADWLDELSTAANQHEAEDDSAEIFADQKDELDNQLCTFTETQKEFKQQHWYYCYTCKMTDSVGVCSVCAKVCHKDHEVSYAKYGSFFCDCGAKEDKSCQALTSRTLSRPAASVNRQALISTASEDTTFPSSKLIAQVTERQRASLTSVISESKETIWNIMKQSGLRETITNLLTALEPEYLIRYNKAMPQESAATVKKLHQQLATEEKSCTTSDQLVVHAMSSPDGMFDGVKPSFSGDQGTTIKQLISSHMIRRQITCKISPEGKDKSLLLVASDKGKITSLQLSSLYKALDSNKQRPTLTKMSQQAVPFPILTMCANPIEESMVAVSGLKDCLILTFNSSGAIVKTLTLQPALDTGNFIVKCLWLPGQMASLVIITADFIKIYNLQLDVISPQYYYLLPTGKVRDVTFCLDPQSNSQTILVMSSSGHVYSQTLSEDSQAVHGPFYITNVFELSHPDISTVGRVVLGGGTSIYYSHSLHLLMLSYTQAQSFVCSVNSTDMSINQITKLALPKSNKVNGSQPLVGWAEATGHPGLVFCLTQSTNSPLALYITPGAITVQEVKVNQQIAKSASNKSGKVVDFVAVRQRSESSNLLTMLNMICEDGSLKVFIANDRIVNLWTQSNLNPPSPFIVQKQSKRKTSSKHSQGSTVQMPVDYFESCEQTNDIEYGGADILEIYNKNQIKHRLITNNQYIACTKAESFKMEIRNLSTTQVLAGVRILVGNHSSTKVPRSLEIFGRTKTLSCESPRWFDFAFTKDECLRASDKIVLTFASAPGPDHVSFVDSIKVYTKSKESVGWSLEAQATSARQQHASSRESRDRQATSTAGQNVKEDAHQSEGCSTAELDAAGVTSPPLAVTPIDRLLSSALTVLRLYIQHLPEEETNKAAIVESASKLVKVLPPQSVSKAVHQLLQSLKQDSSSIHQRMDTIRVSVMKSWLSLPMDDLDPRTYQLILDWLRQIGINRPANLKLLSQLYDNDQYDRKLLTQLLDTFLYMYSKKPTQSIYSPACVPGLQCVRSTVAALVEVTFLLYRVNDNQAFTQFVAALALKLLFHSDSAVRFACKQAMFKVLQPHSKPSTSKLSSRASVSPPKGETRAPATADQVDRTHSAQAPPTAQAPPPQQVPAQIVEAPAEPVAAEVQLPAAAAAQLLHHGEMHDLQDWLEHEPAIIDDLELAIALSLQNQQEGQEPEDDDAEDEAEDDEAEDDEFFHEEIEEEDRDDDDDDYQPEIQDPADIAEQARAAVRPADPVVVIAGADSDLEEMASPLQIPAITDLQSNNREDSDIGGHLSAHSSTEGVQNIGLPTPVPTSTTAQTSATSSLQRKLKSAIRDEIMSQGLAILETCDGMKAIPYLQVLYMLLAELDSPNDMIVLQECLQTLLNRLVDFSRPADDFMKRTHKSEVELLVLRLFSVLMSNSHSNSSQSASVRQNVCSANVLIQANSLKLFKPLLGLLLNFWKNYSYDTDSRASAVPIINTSGARHDLAPFFLRQYVKEHPADVFEVFPQLQTEMVLRLIYQIKKVSDSSPDILSIEFDESWSKVLSEYMSVCDAAFIKRQVRKLLNYICGTKENYRRVRDSNTITLRMQSILTSAGPQATSLPYTTLNSIVDQLKGIQDIVNSRCVNWQLYCVSHPATLEQLLNLCIQVQHPSFTDNIMSLLQAAVAQPQKKSDATLTDEEGQLHMRLTAILLYRVDMNTLSEFIKSYLLQTNQTSTRQQVQTLLLTIFNQSEKKDQLKLLKILWSHWPSLSLYGKKADKYVDLLGYMLIEVDMPSGDKQRLVEAVVEKLRSSNRLLSDHPNASIYNLLQELVDMEGYYLEREPCITCNDPEVSYSNIKLNNIKVDNKFTTTTQMIKLTSSHMVNKITIRISDIKKSKMVKTLAVFYSTRTVQSAVELKNRVGIWQLAKKVNLSSAQPEVKIEFNVPITASNLMFEYKDFYENNTSSPESLPCPRCSATVPANPGICVNCGENVFQCHKCRSINYDERDPFLCNTCGFCKYAKFDITLTAKACIAVDPITSEEDRSKTMSTVNTLLEKADKIYGDIQETRVTLERLLLQLSTTKSDTQTTASAAPGHVNKYIQQVALKYNDEAKKQYEELSRAMQKVLLSRRELLQFDRSQTMMQDMITPSSSSVNSGLYLNDQLAMQAQLNEEKRSRQALAAQYTEPHTRCYGCLTASVTHCITLLQAFTTQSFTTFSFNAISELVKHNLNTGPIPLRRDAMILLCAISKGSERATESLHDILEDRVTEAMTYCTSAASLAMNIRSEMLLLSQSVMCEDKFWERRIKTVIKLYCKALQNGKSHVIEAIALACLEIIKGQILYKPSSTKFKDKKLQDIAGVTVAAGDASVDILRWFSDETTLTYNNWLQKQKTDAEDSLERKYFNKWLRYKRVSDNKTWLTTVLFNPASQKCRQTSADIIENLSSSPERKLMLVDHLTSLLHKVRESGINASPYLDLYKKLISSTEIKYYLVIKHKILAELTEHVSREIDRLAQLEESTLGADLSLGWALHALISLIKMFIDDEKLRQRYKSKLVGTVLDGYLNVRKLVVQRTAIIESTQELLQGLLEQLTTGTEVETRQFMSVCIQTVNKYSPSDLRSPVFIFERLCSIIRPEESDASEFLIILEKDPQQEDFLQGRMSGNPYLSKEAGMGPLMRDIKNKICTDCELVALLEDDSGMELLVNNKIISLDLAVTDVYKKVWQPARENEPMRIVYRMRGLLGDATEDMINSLENKNNEEEDTEAVYRMAAVMKDCGGLDVMLRRLDYVRDYQRGKQLVSVLLKLFDYCVKLQVNRVELIKPEKQTISVMLRGLNRALRAEQQSAIQASSGQSNTEKVLQVMETVLHEASHLPPGQYTEFTKGCGDSDQLTLLLDRVNSPFVRDSPSVLEALMRLIPFLACGEEEKMRTLIEHFKPYLNFLQFDAKHSDNEVTYLECFCVITSGIKQNANGSRLKQMMIDSGILSDAIDYITVLAPQVKTLLATDTEDWKGFVGRPCLPYVLRLLTGLCSGHTPSQQLVGETMIPILHKLEQMSSHSQVGSLAENLIETLCQNAEVKDRINQIRAQTKAEKKRLAMAVREKQLQSIGMKTNKKGQVISTSPIMKDAESLKEETGLICSICREGYHNQPNKLLAVYTFTKRVSIEEHETRSRKTPGMFTVSHMNIVHVDCHTAAVRLASSRDEWESASLHNSNARCNGLLPLWGPQVSETSFTTALAKHNSYLRDNTELRDDSFSLTAHDIKLLLLKFANEQPFSTDSGGGGRNSNMQLIPYELLISLYVMNTQRTNKQKERNLQAFLDATKSRWVESCYEVEGPLYWLVMSLMLFSRDKWNASKLRMLERLLVLQHCRSVAPGGATSLSDKSVKPYSVYKPVLVLFGIISAMYRIMFKGVSAEADWSEGLMKYIRESDNSLAEASEKIVSEYEKELLTCESLAEMFDVLGLLDQVDDPDKWLADLFQTL